MVITININLCKSRAMVAMVDRVLLGGRNSYEILDMGYFTVCQAKISRLIAQNQRASPQPAT